MNTIAPKPSMGSREESTLPDPRLRQCGSSIHTRHVWKCVEDSSLSRALERFRSVSGA